MGQAQATENILCPGAQSLETHCTPELHMHIPKVGSTLQTKSVFFIFSLLLNKYTGLENCKNYVGFK